MDEVEKVARAMAKAEGLDFDEVCGSESGDYECDSGTCIAAYHEDHDADAVRYWYLKLSKAAIAALDEARGDPVAKVDQQRIADLEAALAPFARHVGKRGSTVTLTIGDDTWTGTLTTDDFERAADTFNMRDEAYRNWKE